LAFLKPNFEILAFFNTFGFFGNKKARKIWLFQAYFQPEKSGFFRLISSRIDLALAKHSLSCIFITNLFGRGYITIRGVVGRERVGNGVPKPFSCFALN